MRIKNKWVGPRIQHLDYSTRYAGIRYGKHYFVRAMEAILDVMWTQSRTEEERATGEIRVALCLFIGLLNAMFVGSLFEENMVGRAHRLSQQGSGCTEGVESKEAC
jgi:hypothetical protein